MRPLAWCGIYLLVLAGLAVAQEPAVRRADVARALMRFERAFDPAALDAAEVARVNRAFDRATLAYFAGDARGTLAQLDQLTLELLGLARDPAAQAAIALRVRLDPPRAVASVPRRVRWETLHGTPDPAITVRLASDGFEPLDLRPATGDAPVSAGKSGTSSLWLELPGGTRLDAGSWSVVERDCEEVRAELLARLDRLEASSGVRRATGCARSRLALLQPRPDEEETTQLLLDPVALAAELASELDALEAGRDPYALRAGDQWRTLVAGGATIPYRVAAPAAATTRDRRLPLLVAFHGFKGDENMFRWAYGRGRLLELAAREGWLVCTPRTEPFLRAPAAFDALVDALAEDYPVDRDRVLLLGHSMGSQAVTLLLQGRERRIAGAVLFSGAAGKGDTPTLSVRGALDPLGGFGRKAGPGDQLVEGFGHTLVVDKALDDAVRFLQGVPPRRRYY